MEHIDTGRDEQMTKLVDNCDDWGKANVNQETTWDVEDVPEAKPRTDENPNVWPTFVNKGTNGWEESCRRKKVTPGSHHQQGPMPGAGWNDAPKQPAPPANPPSDSWNKWSGSQQQQHQPQQPQTLPWTGGNSSHDRMSTGTWSDEPHRQVSSSRDESPMSSGAMWNSGGGGGGDNNNNWNNNRGSGYGTWQAPPSSVVSPVSDRIHSWNDGGNSGQWNAKKGSSSGDSGDFETEPWNSHKEDNDFGNFDELVPKRWSSGPSQGMSRGMGNRQFKSSEIPSGMLPPTGDSGFGHMNPQRSALTENLMGLGVSKDDATKALIENSNDLHQSIRWLVQQGKLPANILNNPMAMRPSSGQAYPPGSPNQGMNQQNLTLQDRIRIAQQKSQMKLNALPPSSNQVIVEQLRKAVHQGYLNQHVLNMQLNQDVLKLIHDLINVSF